MPDFDPTTNGHPKSNGQAGGKSSASGPRRGGGILLMAVVSAMTGLNLMLGGGLGFVVGALTDAGDATPALVVLGAGLGAAAGVFFGVRVALGFGGSSGISSQKWLTAWGFAGLVGSIALAALVASPLTPIICILLPGLAAALGDRYSVKKHLAATGQAKPKPKVREQEEAPE
ncbi:MAG TPA: hypothetical protein VFV09_10980 [Actinomycetota bacterium]|nr:hypothetical protein [Actinomycetota bacterium]